MIVESVLNRRRRWDHIARIAVSIGGFAVIAAIVGILVVIIKECLPLFSSAEIGLISSEQYGFQDNVLFAGMNESRRLLYLVTADGKVVFYDLNSSSKKPLDFFTFSELKEATLLEVSQLELGSRTRGIGGDASAETERYNFVASTSNGSLLVFEVELVSSYDPRKPTVEARVNEIGLWPVNGANGHPLTIVRGRETEDSLQIVAVGSLGGVFLCSRNKSVSLIEERWGDLGCSSVESGVNSPVTQVLLDDSGQNIYIGTKNGEIIRSALKDSYLVPTSSVFATHDTDISIDFLGLLLGHRRLISVDSHGQVLSWLFAPQETSSGQPDRSGKPVFGLKRIDNFGLLQSSPVAYASSSRKRFFAVASKGGEVNFYYSTPAFQRAKVVVPENLRITRLNFSPKADELLGVTASGDVLRWSVRDPHGDINLTRLFARLWYDDYPGPEWVWQSSGATDAFEAKLSLVPLVFGTIKATFYALLLAVPLALLGAIYTSQFLSPSLRDLVKSAVEILAALPSVVLGFLGGLWLAPMLADHLLSFALYPLLLFFSVMLISKHDSRWIGAKRPLIMGMVILVVGYVAMSMGEQLEVLLFAGDFTLWLESYLGISYDQRNSIVAGIAMGFAVVPIIFTIAEDSLSNIPKRWKAASLALGATPWQTVWTVVLPAAMPGLFSAVMIGFGRAIGETMIVLMATGNTPIMEILPFTGFRAMSANIAVELPEAPYRGSLYRVLFFSAFVLFIFTFAVNTLSEVVRSRLRRNLS